MSSQADSEAYIYDYDKEYRYHPEYANQGTFIPLEKRLNRSFHKSSVNKRRSSGVNSCINGSSPLEVSPSLSQLQINGAQRKRGRAFHRIRTGVSLARRRGRLLRFLTLTTCFGYNRKNLSRDVQILFKRIEHASPERDNFQGFKVNYVKQNTSEGNGVAHILFTSSPKRKGFIFPTLDNLPHCRKRKGGFPVNPKYDLGFVPFDWIKSNWADITGNPNPKSQNVYIEKAFGGDNRISGYLCQYCAGQSKAERLSWSDGWVYRGFAKDWKPYSRRLAELYSQGFYNKYEKAAVFSDWDKDVFSRAVALDG